MKQFRFCGFETSFYGSATDIFSDKFSLVVQKNGIYLNNIKLQLLNSQQRFVIASASNGIQRLTHVIKYGIVCSPSGFVSDMISLFGNRERPSFRVRYTRR